MRAVAILAGLLAVAAAAQAARLPELSEMGEDADFASLANAWQGDGSLAGRDMPEDNEVVELEGGVTVGGNGYNELEGLALDMGDPDNKGKWPIRLAAVHVVKPALHGAFIHAFWRYQERSLEIKGVQWLRLFKVAGDNVLWRTWIVYEDVDALIRHARSEALRDFATYLTIANVPVKLWPHVRLAGAHHHSAENEAAEDAADNKRKWPVRTLSKFYVPGEHEEFVEEWKKLEAKIGGAKGNWALTLSKHVGDNVVFTVYGAWDSHEAFWKALRSRAARDFHGYVADRKIVATTEKLWKVPPPSWKRG